eukprot:TRINITY_DN1437_c0_g1_i2.p4 TRINITY_DN1437_c0_g1~~TRINITY_DN1437_c0_g1_i2.p4  ORF type:complete len:166 (-),score=22.97 TRINITY_DN1437_c0_g1_i2:1355-1852(-)
MYEFLKGAVFGGSKEISRTVDFDDFGTSVTADAQSQYTPTEITPPQPLEDQTEKDPRRNSLGHSGQRNYMRVFRQGSGKMTTTGQAYDNVAHPKDTNAVWDYVRKNDYLRRMENMERKSEDVVHANEVRQACGQSAEVENVIKQADKRGDGKLDYKEVVSMLNKP